MIVTNLSLQFRLPSLRFRRVPQAALKPTYFAFTFFLLLFNLKRNIKPQVQASRPPSRASFSASSYLSGRLSSRVLIRLLVLSFSALVTQPYGILSRSIVLSSTSPIVLTPLSYIPLYPILFQRLAPDPSIFLISRQYYGLSARTSARFIGLRIVITSDSSALYKLYIPAQVVYYSQVQLGTCRILKEKLYIQRLYTASLRIFLVEHSSIISRISIAYARLGFTTARITVIVTLASQIVQRSIYPIPPLSFSRQAQKSYSNVFYLASYISRQYSFSSRRRIGRGIGIKRIAYLSSDIIRVFAISTLPLRDRQNRLYVFYIVSNLVTISSQNYQVYSLLSIPISIPRYSYQQRFSSDIIQIPSIVIVCTLPIVSRQDFSRFTLAPIAFVYRSSSSITTLASSQLYSIIDVLSTNIRTLSSFIPNFIPLIRRSASIVCTRPSITTTNSRQLIGSPQYTPFRTSILPPRVLLMYSRIFALAQSFLIQLINLSSIPIFSKIAYINSQSTLLQAFSQSRNRIAIPSPLISGLVCPLFSLKGAQADIIACTVRTLLSISLSSRKAY